MSMDKENFMWKEILKMGLNNSAYDGKENFDITAEEYCEKMNA